MQCIFINLFLKAKCFVFYSELHVHEKMLIMRCAFSVNSYLALVYHRWPLNIVFHQEFIIVLYFGAKKNVVFFWGWEEGGSDLSSLGWHCRCHSHKRWVSSTASTTGENGHLPGFILKVSLFSLYLQSLKMNCWDSVLYIVVWTVFWTKMYWLPHYAHLN